MVALTDQWYLSYGDTEWAEKVSTHIHSSEFNGYNDKIMESFDHVSSVCVCVWCCEHRDRHVSFTPPHEDDYIRLLLVVEHDTNFPLAYAIRDHTAFTVSITLFKLYSVFDIFNAI